MKLIFVLFRRAGPHARTEPRGVERRETCRAGEKRPRIEEMGTKPGDPAARRESGSDGIGELFFDSQKAMEQAMSSPRRPEHT
jgi:hypothetical protein